MEPIEKLQEKLSAFAKDRDWEQFHSPKNLAIALSVEASELLEHFQWLSTDASERKCLSDATIKEVENEIADVFLYLLRLSDRLEVNIVDAAENKLAINAKKYPISLSKGNAVKHSRRIREEK
ncbi:NTP pyrophosphatase, house-cleaning of non-canonical NTPs [Marinobacter daqiaonensis]|uniref:NTP pyrophosphatase, house-cleaning of non-canonical NTPs n=1 Tax=Marinobacter daqiaonensis TaxID=650891 RepID=A0A1I6HSM3_9GAMM|nr:nucleotide pyrophosphohydrolase [Marinobacter daqiaonensis]SFR57462.1 NTP pyrophosphatase, house-cleaning of non-canonical NTPs [Marinobacter daqiaonensis]